MPASKIIIIAGPTASGKSGLALALATQLDGIVINADSMQVYRDIPILAAAPSPEDLQIAPHKLYGIYDATVRGNVVDWLSLCKNEIAAARQMNKTPIIAGGTGMYIEALTNGVTPIPETPDVIRHKVGDMLKNEGLPALYKFVCRHDPETAARLSENDTTRLRRAAEIWLHTGKSLSYWHTVPLIANYHKQEFVKIYINPPREALDIRGRIRFDAMIKQGAVEEVRRLMEKNISDSFPAMRALGVQELKSFLNGSCLLSEAVEQAKLHTRQYAKRQTTWFNNRFMADFRLKACFDDDKNFVDDIKKTL